MAHTEVLVNDGGAPARILPFQAGAVLEAGQCVKIATDGKVELAADEDFPVAGVALTAAAAVGDIVNVVTGKGVILNIKCAAAVNRGDPLKVDESVPGELVIRATGDTDSKNVGYALEDAGAGTAARGLTQVLVC